MTITKEVLKKRGDVVAISLVLAISAIFRLTHALTAYDDPYIQNLVGDERHYHQWALSIAQGSLTRGAPFFTTPMYAYFMGGIFSLFGTNMKILLFINTIMGMATSALIYLTARHVLGRFSSIFAAMLFALCLAPLFYESFLEKTTCVLFLTSLSFYLILSAFNNGGVLKWLAAGIAVGLASITHALMLVFIPSVLFCIAPRPREPGSAVHGIKFAALFLAGAILSISPATIHNYMQADDFVLITYNGGQNFYTGNHSGNLTGLYTSPAFSIADLRYEEDTYNREAIARTGRALKPSEVSSFWYKKGLEEIWENPKLSIVRFLRRLNWTLGTKEITDTRTYEFYRERLPVLKLPFWGFGLVSMLALVGSIFLIRSRKYLLFISFSVLYSLALSCFFVYGRYRLPLIVPFSILAAATLSTFTGFIKERKYIIAAISICLLTASGWYVFHDVLPGYRISYLADYYNQGRRYAELGKFDLAIAEYEKALSVRPGYHPGWEIVSSNLAEIYILTDKREKAIKLLSWAIKRKPENKLFKEKLEEIRGN